MIGFYPISLLYGFIVGIREFLYKHKIFPSYKFQTKILSIGNITFGGTGKTPIVDFLLEALKEKKIAVLSRGYKRSTTGFYKVDPTQEGSVDLYGDEPVFLAKSHPNVPIFVCEDRVEGCRRIESLGKFDLIIADDGFQHLRLQRDIDVVVIDATEKLNNYNYPPMGRARSSFRYLERADYIFLTKTNLCDKSQLARLRSKLASHKVIEFESAIESFCDLNSNQKISLKEKDVFLLSGIGNPKTFENLIQLSLSHASVSNTSVPNICIKKHFIYKDHYRYTLRDIANIKSQVADGVLLTTEKDAVKLKELNSDMKIYVSQLKFINRTSMEDFYEIIK